MNYGNKTTGAGLLACGFAAWKSWLAFLAIVLLALGIIIWRHKAKRINPPSDGHK